MEEGVWGGPVEVCGGALVGWLLPLVEDFLLGGGMVRPMKGIVRFSCFLIARFCRRLELP